MESESEWGSGSLLAKAGAACEALMATHGLCDERSRAEASTGWKTAMLALAGGLAFAARSLRTKARNGRNGVEGFLAPFR